MVSFGMSPGSTAAGTSPTQQQTAVDSSTPWVAAADGNLSLLQSSLQTLQLPITAADENGYTLLHAAASYNHAPILNWLVDTASSAGGDNNQKAALLHAVDGDGDGALHYASTKEAAEFLIQHGVNPAVKNSEGKTALESKQAELQDTMEDQEDEDDDEDEDLVQLKRLIEYLQSLQNPAQ